MKARTKRRIVGALGGALLLLMYGLVGGMDCNTIPVCRGFLEALGCILGAWICLSKAGMIRR